MGEVKRPTRDSPRELGRGHTTMERRKFVVGLGALASGSAAAMGTGAFNSVSANRGVSVEVADDSSAFLGLNATSKYSSESGSGQLNINLDSASNGNGTGINADATTNILNVFEITNNGNQEVAISIDSASLNSALDNGTADAGTEQLHFFVGESGGVSLDTYDPDSALFDENGVFQSGDSRVIGPGEVLPVGLYVVNAGSDWDVDEDVTINAYSETALRNNPIDT